MSKFAAVFQERGKEVVEPYVEAQPVLAPVRKLGRPRGKRSDDENTQVTGYVPARLYYDVRIKLMEKKRRDRKVKTDFSDLLRSWMERWLAEQS
jgi:hypothetical protein